MKILITTSSFGKLDKAPLNKLEQEGFEVVMNPHGRKLSSPEVKELYAQDINGVIAGTEEISEEIINQAKELKVISRVGIGTDAIDLEAAKEKEIEICKTVEPVVDAVAELIVGLLLTFMRKIILADSSVRDKSWQKPMGNLLKGKKIGIIGLGNIGKRVVELLRGFGVEFVASDQVVDEEFANKYKVTYTDLKNLLKESDVISLHVPYCEDTKGLISAAELELMKPSAILINTSRGGIVDEEALVSALKQKKINGAILDVFAKEPYEGPLAKLDNVLLTPHIGSYAKECRIKMESEAVDNLINALKSKL